MLAAAQEVAMPILVSTITTIVVFFPVLFMAGIARFLFLPLAMTIAFALIMSFFVSRTVTPLLCLYWLKGRGHEDDQRGIAGVITRWLDGIDHGYAKILKWTLGHRLVTVVSIVALFASSLFLRKKIGTEFFPETDEGQFSIIYKTPIGTRSISELAPSASRRSPTRRWRACAIKIDTPIYTTMLPPGFRPGAPRTQNTESHAANVQINLVGVKARIVSDVEATERVRPRCATRYLNAGHFSGESSNAFSFGSAAALVNARELPPSSTP